MRATTGRFSLSITGRAVMLLNVNDENRMARVFQCSQNGFE